MIARRLDGLNLLLEAPMRMIRPLSRVLLFAAALERGSEE